MKFLKIGAPILVVISIFLYFIIGYIEKLPNHREEINLAENIVSESTTSAKVVVTNDDILFVDVSGAVVHPGLYKLAQGSRVFDLLKLAGGVSKYADTQFISQNLNLSQKLKDSEKVYIPFAFDRDLLKISGNLNLICPNVSNKPVSSVADAETNNDTDDASAESKIDVNTATKQELLDLPGIGEAFATKIIEGRPYENIDAFYSYIKFGASTKEKLVKLLTVN